MKQYRSSQPSSSSTSDDETTDFQYEDPNKKYDNFEDQYEFVKEANQAHSASKNGFGSAFVNDFNYFDLKDGSSSSGVDPMDLDESMQKRINQVILETQQSYSESNPFDFNVSSSHGKFAGHSSTQSESDVPHHE